MSPHDTEPLGRAGNGESGPIAIVGIGCRYGKLRGPAEFWQWVRSGSNAVREVPQHRIDLGYDVDHFYDPRLRIPGKISSKRAGFVEHPELFDPAALGIAPRDAVTMDPQQRLMAEVSWDALEDAGIVPESIVGERVAVILGYMAEDYSRERTGVLGEEAVFRAHDVFAVAGMSHAVLSGRISFLLGLKGPSFTLDTACSSSLIATHLACQSLRCGESKMALAGGVNIFLSPEGNIALSRSGMLSMSGACKAFDASADGFVRAEGAGVVVLRPLADALSEGNPIYAVIRGSGISTDGRDGGHMMAPSREGQVQAMRDAYAQAGMSPSEIHFVEAHGTGTMIGDPVEIAALAEVMGPGRSPDRPLRVASVKGNLGHTESASGVAGLIKAALAIRNRELPAQLHFETPNPAIPWDEVPIRVQTETTPWPYPGLARVGVNSFGISGTNAHVVLESPPEPESHERVTAPSQRPVLLPISAHDANALHEMVEQHRDALLQGERPGLENLAYTLSRRRTQRAHRLSVVAASTEEMRCELDAYLAGNPTASVQTGVAPTGGSSKIVMVFPGQGAQWLGMGRGLLENESSFAASIDRIDATYRGYVDWSLRDALEGRGSVGWTSRLDVLQPVLVALEIALAELWGSWGIRPDHVIGQSLGEIAAAHVAGCLRLEDVARVACHRGRVVSRASGQGAMAVIFLSRDRVEEAIRPRSGCVEVAGSSSPTTTIVSGDRDVVNAVVADLEAQDVFARRLEVDFASHCFHMDPLLDSFRARIEGVQPMPARLPFLSTVDGREKVGDELDAEYWVRNLRAPVAFDLGLARSIQGGGRIFLEVSPHPTLSRAIAETAQTLGHPAVHVSSLQRDADEQRSLAVALGELFVRGVGVDFAALHPRGRVVETPLYAYQRKRFWFGERTRSHRFRPVHPLLGVRSQSSIDPRLHSWDLLLDPDSGSFIRDFRVDGTVGVPTGLYPELALGVSEAMWRGEPVELALFDLIRPMPLGKTGRRLVQVVLRVGGERLGTLQISSREHEDAPWELHATCALRPARRGQPLGASLTPPQDLGGNETLNVDLHFASLEGCGVSLGPKSRTLRDLVAEPGSDAETLLARMKLPRAVESEWYAYRAHPAILEGCFQLVGSLLEPPTAVRVTSVSKIALAGDLGSDCWCRVRRRRRSAAGAARVMVDADLEFFDREGAPLGKMEGVRAEALPERASQGGSKGVYHVDWVVAGPLSAEGARVVDQWVILSDSVEEAGSLAAELQKLGAASFFCERIEDLESLAGHMDSGQRPWGLVLLAWADLAPGGPSQPLRAQVIRDHCRGASQIWVATSGLQRARPGDPVSVGAGRVVAGEVDFLASDLGLQHCRLFDASSALDHAERLRLADLVGRESDEWHFAARGEDLYVPRLIAADAQPLGLAVAKPSEVAGGDRNFRAIHTGRDGLECLALEEWAAPELLAGSVEVEVRSAALSQLDVLSGLGLARASARAASSVGLDFAGVITGIADCSSGFEVGDEVIGVHDGALARRLVLSPLCLARKPPSLDFNLAAGIPFAYLVAKYALQLVARLRAGERILIPSAAGGVGQALVRVARSVGAEVHATAGSPLRRAALRELGARVVGSAPDALAPTDGQPEAPNQFDVIVSGESGPAVHAMLARLAPGGRYVDLCPRSGFERPELGALRMGANRSLSAVDVAEMMRTELALVSGLLDEIVRDLDRGRLGPLPTKVFPLSEAARALRFMAQNRHAGRVCVDFASADRVPIRALEQSRTALAEVRGSFVVSGGEPELRAGIVEGLRGQGVEDVVELRSDEIEGYVARHPEPRRWGGWIHVRHEALHGAEESKAFRGLSRAGFRAWVSVHESAGDGPTRGRAWESRLWCDRLLLSRGEEGSRSVSISVGRDHTARQITDLVARAWLVDASELQAVGISDSDLSRRIAEAPSPLLAQLELGSEGRRGLPLRREEILSSALPERRIATQQFVVGELAGVLGLSDGQRAEVDVGNRLGDLGLDSLMTMELFVGIAWDLQLEVAADWFPPNPTIAEIVAVLVDRLEEVAPKGTDS